MTGARFSGSAVKTFAFLLAFSTSPHKNRIAGQKPVEDGFLSACGCWGGGEGLVTCKKTHQEEKAATGDVGVTFIYLVWAGYSGGASCPTLRGQPGWGALCVCVGGGGWGVGSAAGAGGRRGPGAGRCAEPLTLPCPCAHALRRCVFKQRKVAQPKVVVRPSVRPPLR